MGKILQVRVSAQTYNPEDMDRAWPRLVRLVWPDGGRDFMSRPVDQRGTKGVLELVQELHDTLRFRSWPEELKEALGPGIEKAVELKAKLETALGDWKASEANTISHDLEDALTAIEAKVPKRFK